MQHVLTHVSCWSQVCQSLTCTFIHSAIDACPSHSSTLCHLAHISSSANMKRKAEGENPWERHKKIPVPPAWPAGCPHCNKTALSWNEWACYCTVLQDSHSDNLYWACPDCFRKVIQKHYWQLRWWRWSGEGDSQEQFATSSCSPIISCEA